MKNIYEIMHGEKAVARIDEQGHCRIYAVQFMPFNLYLEENDRDIDTLVSNVTNFYYWCATRVLTLDRQYAKEILNSIGAVQAVTDRDRAKIGLNQIKEIEADWFAGREKEYEMFIRRLNIFKC